MLGYQLAIVIVRLVLPLSILKRPLYGTLACALIDALDVFFLNIFGGVPSTYQSMDKFLDLYYLTFSFYMSRSWERIPRQICNITFAQRLIGICLFELTQAHLFLFFFPNMFEMWWTFWAAREKFFPTFKLTRKRLAIVLICLAVPKMIQEYALHVYHPDLWIWVKEKFPLFAA